MKKVFLVLFISLFTALSVMAAIIFAIIVYFVAVFVLKCIKEDDVILLPHGDTVVKILKKARLIR